MKLHRVYFYGSTKIILGHNSLSSESIRKRNQIIGFDGIDVDPDLVEYGKKCFNSINEDGSRGETGALVEKNLSIVPFRYLQNESLIIRQLEDVFLANENYINGDIIAFPLLMLKSGTDKGYKLLGERVLFDTQRSKKLEFKGKWCCFAHYHLHLIKVALENRGYTCEEGSPIKINGNLIDKYFEKDRQRVNILADAGI